MLVGVFEKQLIEMCLRLRNLRHGIGARDHPARAGGQLHRSSRYRGIPVKLPLEGGTPRLRFGKLGLHVRHGLRLFLQLSKISTLFGRHQSHMA